METHTDYLIPPAAGRSYGIYGFYSLIMTFGSCEMDLGSIFGSGFIKCLTNIFTFILDFNCFRVLIQRFELIIFMKE